METKPALKTTEFWIHAALQIFFLLNTLNVYTYLPDKWSGLVQAILAAGYMLARGQAKTGIPYNPEGTPIEADVAVTTTTSEPTSTA